LNENDNKNLNMLKSLKSFILFTSILFLSAFSPHKKPVTIYIIGDSTVANYATNYDEGKDYYKTRYPVAVGVRFFLSFLPGCFEGFQTSY
jgi:hypothetical protein